MGGTIVKKKELDEVAIEVDEFVIKEFVLDGLG
jgi:hypothetical protein